MLNSTESDKLFLQGLRASAGESTKTRRLSGVIPSSATGPVRIPEPYEVHETPAVSGHIKRVVGLHSKGSHSQDSLRGQNTPENKFENTTHGVAVDHSTTQLQSACSAMPKKSSNDYYYPIVPGADNGAVMMSRSLDSKPSPSVAHLHVQKNTHLDSGGPSHYLGPNRDVSQVIA